MRKVKTRNYYSGSKYNKRQRIPKGHSKMDNPEKFETQGTQDEGKQNKQHNIICVGHHYRQTNRNNINKTQSTGDKDEQNIALMRNT